MAVYPVYSFVLTPVTIWQFILYIHLFCESRFLLTVHVTCIPSRSWSRRSSGEPGTEVVTLLADRSPSVITVLLSQTSPSFPVGAVGPPAARTPLPRPRPVSPWGRSGHQRLVLLSPDLAQFPRGGGRDTSSSGSKVPPSPKPQVFSMQFILQLRPSSNKNNCFLSPPPPPRTF